MLTYSIMTLLTIIPVLYVFGVHIYVKVKKNQSVVRNIKFFIFISTIILDALIIFYSTIEPPNNTGWKNINIMAVQIVDGFCLYLLGFFIIMKAGNKHDRKHEWLLGLKIIWFVSLIVEVSFVIKVILNTLSRKKDASCENIFANSKAQCGSPTILINSVG